MTGIKLQNVFGLHHRSPTPGSTAGGHAKVEAACKQASRLYTGPHRVALRPLHQQVPLPGAMPRSRPTCRQGHTQHPPVPPPPQVPPPPKSCAACTHSQPPLPEACPRTCANTSMSQTAENTVRWTRCTQLTVAVAKGTEENGHREVCQGPGAWKWRTTSPSRLCFSLCSVQGSHDSTPEHTGPLSASSPQTLGPAHPSAPAPGGQTPPPPPTPKSSAAGGHAELEARLQTGPAVLHQATHPASSPPALRPPPTPPGAVSGARLPKGAVYKALMAGPRAPTKVFPAPKSLPKALPPVKPLHQGPAVCCSGSAWRTLAYQPIHSAKLFPAPEWPAEDTTAIEKWQTSLHHQVPLPGALPRSRPTCRRGHTPSASTHASSSSSATKILRRTYPSTASVARGPPKDLCRHFHIPDS